MAKTIDRRGNAGCGRGASLTGAPLALVCCLSLPGSVLAQAGAGGYRAGPVYSQSFPRIGVVLDIDWAQRDRVKQVSPSQVELIETGTLATPGVKAEAFRDTGRGMAVVLLVDVSGSMKGQPLEALRGAVNGFVAEVTPNDKVAMVTFADDEREDIPFGSPIESLRRAVEGLQSRGTVTQIYRAVVKAYQMLEREPGLPLRRRIVVISDGRDEGSSYTPDDVLKFHRRLGVPIDTIGVAATARPQDLSALERLSDNTGGNYRAAVTPEQLRAAASEGMRWLQNSPVIYFDLQHTPKDGQRHQVSIRWQAFGNSREIDIVAPFEQKLPQWVWLAAAGAGLLLLLGILLATLRSRRAPPPPAPVVAPQPFNPQPAIQPPPSDRPSTVPMPVRRPPPVSPIESTPISPAGPTASIRPRRNTVIRTEFSPPAPGQPTAWLIVESGPESGRRYAIEKREVWVGASSGNDMVIEEKTISGRHFCIQFQESDLYVLDQSTNGTKLNGEWFRKERRRLNAGDRLQIGEHTMISILR